MLAWIGNLGTAGGGTIAVTPGPYLVPASDTHAAGVIQYAVFTAGVAASTVHRAGAVAGQIDHEDEE